MAVLHRALFTWFNILIFLILLVLRLDQRIQWNWFIVFIPMWLYDNILLIYIVFNMISHCKNGHDRVSSLRRMVHGRCALENQHPNSHMFETGSSSLEFTCQGCARSFLAASARAGHRCLHPLDTPVELLTMIMKRLLLLLCGLSIVTVTIGTTVTVGTVTVTEVPAGHLAELPCLSSDDHHRFMFWQLTDDQNIIGPGNPLNEEKYNYEVLTGKLLIRGVSTAESGFYKCVSRGVSNNSKFLINVVELIVKKDWEEVWENDFETNLLRGMAAVMVIVVGIAIVLLILTLKKRRQRFFDLEESRENSPARYKENPHSPPASPAPHAVPEPSGIDNMGLDVDFPKVFQQMQKEQVLP